MKFCHINKKVNIAFSGMNSQWHQFSKFLGVLVTLHLPQHKAHKKYMEL